MSGIKKFDSLQQIRQDYLGMKYDECLAQSMRALYYHEISKQEVCRITKIEWLDEYEEFDLMQEHYFVSIAKYSRDKLKLIEEFSFRLLNNPIG